MKRGYFKACDGFFELGLSVYALLILIYFCRRADKYGISFPSITRICKDCGFKSENTARKNINELIARNLIIKLKPAIKGGSNRYKLSENILKIIYASKSEQKYIPPSYYERPPSPNEPIPHHEMRTKEEKEKEEDKKKKEEENSKKQTRDCDITSGGNITSLGEASRYYQNLTDEGKKIFDGAARGLLRTGEPDPRNSIVLQRTVRCRFHELLLGLDKWKKSMPKLVGDEPFYIPMETLKSQHEYVDALSPTVEIKEAAL